MHRNYNTRWHMSILPLYQMLADRLLNPASQETRLTFALGEYPPYYSKKIAQFGKIPERTSSIFNEQDVRIKYRWCSWPRAYEYVRSGRYDGSFTNIKTVEREREFYFSDPILQTDTLFFHLKRTSFCWSDISDIRNRILGMTLGYRCPPEVHEAAQNGDVKIDWVSSNILNFKKLLMQQVDIFPINKDVALHTLQEHFSSSERRKITWSRTPLSINSTYLIFSKKNPENWERIQLFNAGLKSSTRLLHSGFR